jgi:PQQ-like domain
MRTINQFMLLIVGVLLVTSVQAQSPDNQYNFEGQVKWMMLTESGVLVASTGEALVGIKPNETTPFFKIDRLKRVKEENLEPVPGTPYLIIKPRGIIQHTAVIDVVKGKMVFDSKGEDWKGGVTSRHFIGPEMMFVVNGMHKEEGMGKYKQGIGLYDLKTGKLVNIFERRATNLMVGRPDIMGSNIIIPGVKNVECYDIATGAVKWTSDVKNATSITSNDDSNEVYAFRTKGGNTVVYKIDATSGRLLWQEGNKLKGALARYEFTKAGLAVVTSIDNSGKKGLGKLASAKSQSKIYLLDSNSGADLWDKSPKTKGFVSHFYVEENGILFGVASGGLNKISFNGVPQWKKPLKTGANIQLMARVPSGVLYISGSDTDIIDMSTGESVFGKPIKYKKSKSVASTFDEQRNRFLITCSDGVYEIDGENGEFNLINSDFKFEGKEDPTDIEVRERGILLSSSQNLTMLDFNGGENWHKYHRAPGKSAFSVVLLAAVTAASTYASAANSFLAGSSSVSLGPYSSTTTYYNQQADNWNELGDAAFTEMAKRFKASKATENAAFILTKVDGGVGLVKVDKDSGDILNEILLKDKNPMYEVDEFAGFLYFGKGSNIFAYDLNK